jgi:stress response protein YsnF
MAETETIHLLEEEAVVGKRLQATEAVRIHTRVEEDEELVATPVVTETIEVEHVPLDLWVETPVPERQEGDTRIVTLHAEITVTLTRLKAVEEIRITKKRQTSNSTKRVTLRRESAVVERIPAASRRDKS